MKKEIILTGFGKYGTHTCNPTEELVKSFNNKVFNKRTVTSIVLPASYNAFEELKQLLLERKPYAIISTGLSSSIPGMRMELTFKNRMGHHYADEKGVFAKNEPIMEKNHHYLAPIGKAEDLHYALLSKGVPMDNVSTDAGSFVCNALGYKITDAIIKNRLKTQNIFVHVPWSSNYKDRVSHEGKVFLPKRQMLRGLELLIRSI